MNQNYHLDQYGSPDIDYGNYNNFDFPQEDDYFSSSAPAPNVFKPGKQMSLSSIEKALYKTKFENESTAARLSRIESSVFGTNFSNDSESERIARISSAINAQKSARRYDSNKFRTKHGNSHANRNNYPYGSGMYFVANSKIKHQQI